ncbi:MAG: hypothetical protein ACD_24C00190G0005 [uncultured bacterium]|nr:MAG: hypothetical protein ACD_24C00190G0005 [uncultured bacterium]
MEKHKKLHLHITFKKRVPFEELLRKFLYNISIRNKLRSLGLESTSFVNHSELYLELHVVGEKEKLWEMVKWAKNAPAYFKLNEITFHFVEAEVPVDVPA